MAEPMCCDTPMVHNSWAEAYECADAYFTLVDEGYGEGVIETLRVDDIEPGLADTLGHWRASRRSDVL
jgi:hypothetical protein